MERIANHDFVLRSLSLCYLLSSDIPLLRRRQPRLPTVRKFWASEAIVPGGPPRGGPSVCVNCKWRAGNNEIFPARHRSLLALEKPKVAGQIEKIKNGIHAHLEDFNSSVSTSRPRSKIAAPPSPSPNISLQQTTRPERFRIVIKRIRLNVTHPIPHTPGRPIIESVALNKRRFRNRAPSCLPVHVDFYRRS
jgi:hypothetical protein